MKEPSKNSLAARFVTWYSPFALLFFISIYLVLEETSPGGDPAGSRGKYAILAVVALFSTLGLALGVAGLRSLRRRIRRILESIQGWGQEVGSKPGVPADGADEIAVLETATLEALKNAARRTKEINGQRERLQSILGCMIEGVIVLDTQARVVLLNQAAQDMFRLPPEAAVPGMSPMEISRHPEMHGLIKQVLERENGHESIVKEITLGDNRCFEVSATALENREGAPLGNIFVLHEITELKRLEEMRADFVANVSHEMRTPLTAIHGYAETLLHDPPAGQKNAKQFLSIITHHSRRLGRLIDDLLTLSDLEMGNVDLRIARVDVRPLVDQVRDLFREQARNREVALETNVGPDTPAILGDVDRLQQLLINLVDNAIKYTPPGGGVTLMGRTAARENPADDARVELAVSDTGCGIPDKHLARLTERFYRVDKARSRELGGTGLGLAIVKHIVQAHQGELEITSRLQKGTTVQMRFRAAGRETDPPGAIRGDRRHG